MNQIREELAPDIVMIRTIVQAGVADKVLHIAKQHGIRGGTVFYATGTVKNRVLEFFAIADVRKEMVMLLAEKQKADEVLEALEKELKLSKPNHGIAFTTAVCGVVGTRSLRCGGANEEEKETQPMYQMITVIVDKGRAELAMEAASQAGSKGGTIINARGTGIHETSRLFAMDVEPEREIIMILAKSGATSAIVAAIQEKLNLEEPGNGILFVQNVLDAYGLYE